MKAAFVITAITSDGARVFWSGSHWSTEYPDALKIARRDTAELARANSRLRAIGAAGAALTAEGKF